MISNYRHKHEYFQNHFTILDPTFLNYILLSQHHLYEIFHISYSIDVKLNIIKTIG